MSSVPSKTGNSDALSFSSYRNPFCQKAPGPFSAAGPGGPGGLGRPRLPLLPCRPGGPGGPGGPLSPESPGRPGGPGNPRCPQGPRFGTPPPLDARLVDKEEEEEEEEEGHEEWLGSARGSGATFTLVDLDAREVLDKLVLRLMTELRWLSKECWLAGWLSVRLLLVRDGQDARSSSSLASCSPSGHSAGAAGFATCAACPGGNSVGSLALPLSKGA